MILNVGDCVEMKLPNSRGMKVSCHVLAIVKDLMIFRKREI